MSPCADDANLLPLASTHAKALEVGLVVLRSLVVIALVILVAWIFVNPLRWNP
jgi:hypothetical protein